jgi:hypothetical protein
VTAIIAPSRFGRAFVSPPPRRTQQLAEEGIFGRMREFEEDHLIPISVGGNPHDERNLWQEPRFGFWNAEKKDQLEDVMHRRVCDGSISLRAAQDAFRGNWTAAYRRYVGQ